MSAREVRNWSFFDEEANTDINKNQVFGDVNVPEKEEFSHPKYDAPVFELIHNTSDLLKKSGFRKLSSEVQHIKTTLVKDKFKIVVVGEFSRGKSTFINNLLKRDILPVGNLPTTAILTKLTYRDEEQITYVDERRKEKHLPLTIDSWDGLIASENESVFRGVAEVHVKSDWLHESAVEIIDTPGTNDLDERRSSLVNDALLCSDGVIITISALQALSESEKTFIFERLLLRKIPNLLLIITRLDQVKKEERARVIEYIQKKIKSWDVDIPIFIPQDKISVDGMDVSAMIGYEKITAEIEKWTNDTDFIKRRNDNACSHLLSILNIAKTALNEKVNVLSLDEEKREKNLQEKKDRIYDSRLRWEDLRLKMLDRCTQCFKWLSTSIRDKNELLVERLQYEASHTRSPKSWWEEDYPYRLKIELLNLAVSLEGSLSKKVQNDVVWLAQTLKKEFGANITFDSETLAEKEVFKYSKSTEELEFEDVIKNRARMRVGTGALTIAGYLLLSTLGGPAAIFATIGIGTSSAILIEQTTNKKIDEQKNMILNAIATDVPRVIDRALQNVEDRLIYTYNEVVKQAEEQEDLWVKAQEEALQNNMKTKTSKQLETIRSDFQAIENAIETTKCFMEV